MFQFLNPAVLLGLAAAVIPLIIHLLNRRKYREIEFSTIHFLKEMVKKEMRRLKIRQILLLIIRTLIIILLVLAFSRPTLTSQAGFISGRSSSEVVVIIDNSMSMNSLELTGNLLEDVRQWWFQLETYFQTSDRISVILGTNPLKILAEREYYSPDLWEKIAKDIQPSSLKGNLNLATWKALDIFDKSDASGMEIYYVSDFQQSGLDQQEFEEIRNNLNERIKVFLLPVYHDDDRNVSIDSAEVVNQLIEKNGALGISTVLRNQNQENHLNSMVSLILEGERVSQKNINLNPGESELIRFETQIQKTGRISGFVESESDALLEDNRFYFNFYIPEQARILHITGIPENKSLIPTILQPALQKNIFRYRNVSLTEWTSVNLFEYQTVILEGVNQIPGNLVDRLLQYHAAGYGIIIIPGSSLNPAGINDLLEKLKLGTVIARSGNPSDTGQFISLGEVNWNHPLFEGLFRDRKELNPVIFYSYYKIKPAVSSESIIRMQNGDVFLLQGSGSGGSTFLLATPLKPEWTNILIRGFIVPLIYRSIYYSVVKNTDSRMQLQVGDSYSEVFRNLNPPYEFSLRKPSGMEEKVLPSFRGTDVLIQVDENYEPGNYAILLRGETVANYSVNHPADESVQDYMAETDMMQLFPAASWVNSHENLATEIKNSRFGREIWQLLLGLAVILVFAEMFLGYTSSRRQKVSETHAPGENL